MNKFLKFLVFFLFFKLCFGNLNLTTIRLTDKDLIPKFHPISFIVNGNRGTSEKFPYFALIMEGTGRCGVSHCLFDGNKKLKPEDMNIYVGIDHLDQIKNRIPYKAKKFHIHRNYVENKNEEIKLNGEFDIALIELTNPIVLNHNTINLACINNQLLKPHLTYLSPGFGGINTLRGCDRSPKFENELKYAIYKKKEEVVRNLNYDRRKYIGVDAPENISPKNSICMGDSGGPLAFGNHVFGIVRCSILSSRIENGIQIKEFCAGPAIFIRLSNHKQFIEGIVGSDCFCNKIYQ